MGKDDKTKVSADRGRPAQHQSGQNAQAQPGAIVSWRRIISIVTVVVVAVAYQLYRTALITGNYEGMWFSLAHTVIVAIGAVCALRPACQPCESTQ